MFFSLTDINISTSKVLFIPKAVPWAHNENVSEKKGRKEEESVQPP